MIGYLYIVVIVEVSNIRFFFSGRKIMSYLQNYNNGTLHQTRDKSKITKQRLIFGSLTEKLQYTLILMGTKEN